jgi:penicillin-binding protein 1A
MDYDLRHGYRGPEKTLDLAALLEEDENALASALDDLDTVNGFEPALVTAVSAKALQVQSKSGEVLSISGSGLAFVDKMLHDKDPAKRRLKPGAVVRIVKQGEAWRIAQLPQVEAALVALDPENGAIRALVGGFDFNQNKYNHVTQASRQPGSSFKPFIYSAALEKGYTPATVMEDAPLNFAANETGNKAWSPQNYENTFEGAMSLRKALAHSVNTVAIRLLHQIGPGYAQNYITRFGFDADDHPPYLTMALGAGSTTPMEMAGAYAVFANGGYRVKPNLITKIVDHNGKVLVSNKFTQAGNGAPRVIDARNAFIMNSMLQSVIENGTAMRALNLGRSDLAGKTGTTNEHIDAWFAGYSPRQVAVAWIGFDKPRPMGSGETGAGAALPMWIRYMAGALRGVPEEAMWMPDGVDAVSVHADNADRVEYFYHENLPNAPTPSVPPASAPNPAEPNALNQAQQVLQPAAH